MRTQAQIEASRKNGASSKGPKTAQGRARSSQNAFRHGLAAHKFVVLDGEPATEWDGFHDAFRERFQPRDPVEETLVLELAVNQWRLERSWALQTSVIDQGTTEQRPLADQQYEQYDAILVHSFAYAHRTKELAVLGQYETRLTRNFERALKKLNQIRLQHPVPEHEPEPVVPPVQLPPSPVHEPVEQEPRDAAVQAGPIEPHANLENEPKQVAPVPVTCKNKPEIAPVLFSLEPVAVAVLLGLLPVLSANWLSSGVWQNV